MTEIELHAGHALHVSGANKLIKEVEEARRVGKRVFDILKANRVPVSYFEDNASKTQAENLNALVKHHNADRDGLVVSIHFNASGETTDRGIGTEVLFYDQKDLAVKLSSAINKASGLLSRGAKQRTDLAVLASTNEPAVLIEVCFVNSNDDVARYKRHFEKICFAIAETLAAHIGYKLKPSKTVVVDGEKEESEVNLLNETGRKEIRALLLKAGEAGIIDGKHHTKERIAKYSDVELLSYQAAVINREFK